MKHAFRLCLCLVVLFSLTACGSKEVRDVPVSRFGLSDGETARDLAVFPQDLAVYAERVGKNGALMDAERQGRESSRYRANFFAAWGKTVSHLPRNAVFEGVKNMNPAKGYAENLRLWDAGRWQSLIDNCWMDGYGSVPARPAITVSTTPLRRMPTDAPYFLDPGKGGEGFPFDYMQNSTLWVGTPVAVIHVSRDGAWAFVQTRLVSGWAKVATLAAVDQAFIEAWQSRPLAVFVQDAVSLPILDRPDAVTGLHSSVTAHIGTLLPQAPVSAVSASHVPVYTPLRSFEGRAVMAVAHVPAVAIRKNPLPLTPQNMALVGNAMMGQPYGWGGLFSQRDCSAAMHDLFAAFGIWLPRNSRPQGMMGRRIDLDGLAPEQKEARIAREGIPFFSLVSMPGHVGLYLGTYSVRDEKGTRDVPVMFHNMWGLRVIEGRGGEKQEGRRIVGKAVVTSLRPGSEYEGITSPASLLDRINGLAVLPEPLPEER